MTTEHECRRYTLAGYNTDRCAQCGEGPYAHKLWFAWANETPFSRRAALDHTVPLEWRPGGTVRAPKPADPRSEGIARAVSKLSEGGLINSYRRSD